jgi:hypothetical protein
MTPEETQIRTCSSKVCDSVGRRGATRLLLAGWLRLINQAVVLKGRRLQPDPDLSSGFDINCLAISTLRCRVVAGIVTAYHDAVGDTFDWAASGAAESSGVST